MNSTQRYITSIGWLTVLSGLLAFACNVLLAFAVRFNFEAFADPALLFNGFEASQAEFFRWGMITDIWGYYLLLVPAVLYFYEQMESPWRRVFAASGLAYAVIGASGAAILASAGTDLLRAFGQADVTAQAAFQKDFLLVYRVVNGGIWNLLEMGLMGVFCFGAAPLLRPRSKPLFYLTIAMGTSGVLDSLAHTFEWAGLGEFSLNAYLLLAPVWAIWVGILLMKQPHKFAAFTRNA
ncbi:MAG: hypothetical protein ACKVU2_15600 [Saprospiraceae bacterium]